MNLADEIDIYAFEKLISDGYIKTENHPDGILKICTWTPKAMLDIPVPLWPEELVMANGFIVDNQWNIIARGPNTTFEWEQFAGVIPLTSFVVLRDLPGLQGIYYKDKDNNPSIAVEGSFTSDMAIQATNEFREDYSGNNERLLTYSNAFTPIFKLSPLSVTSKNTYLFFLEGFVGLGLGKYIENITPDLWNGLKISQWIYHDDLLTKLEAAAEADYDYTGKFIVRFPDGLQLFATIDQIAQYIRLRRTDIINAIWSRLRYGHDISDLLISTSEEYHPWINGIYESFTTSFTTTKNEVVNEHHRIINEINKNDPRAFSTAAAMSSNKQLINALHFDGDIDKAIWKRLRPKKSEAPYKEATL